MCSGHALNSQGCLRKERKEISRSSLRWWSLNCTSNRLLACRFRFSKGRNSLLTHAMQLSSSNHRCINKAIGALTIWFLWIGTRIQESKSIVSSKCPKYSGSVQTDDLSIVYHSLNLSGFSAATSSSSCLRCGCWSPAWTVWKFSPEQDVIFCLICKK